MSVDGRRRRLTAAGARGGQSACSTSSSTWLPATTLPAAPTSLDANSIGLSVNSERDIHRGLFFVIANATAIIQKTIYVNTPSAIAELTYSLISCYVYLSCLVYKNSLTRELSLLPFSTYRYQHIVFILNMPLLSGLILISPNLVEFRATAHLPQHTSSNVMLSSEYPSFRHLRRKELSLILSPALLKPDHAGAASSSSSFSLIKSWQSQPITRNKNQIQF